MVAIVIFFLVSPPRRGRTEVTIVSPEILNETVVMVMAMLIVMAMTTDHMVAFGLGLPLASG